MSPSAEVELHTLSASPRGTYAPGVYRVGAQVPVEVAAAWLDAGAASLVSGKLRTGAAPEPERDATMGYEVRHTGGGWYDVVGSGGEAVNDGGLRKDDARALAAELGGE